MGYETKIIVVEKHDRFLSMDTDKTYASKIAEFDLCKMGYGSFYHKCLPDFRETSCYYYADDGNTQVLEDRYGEALKEIRIPALIKILKKDAESDSYARIPAIIAMLEGMVKYMSNYNLVALHYGY